MNQKVLLPSYFRDFTCIGGACEDTCCAGWYIAIDELTYKKYKKVKDPIMKKRLDKELVAKKGIVSKEHVAKIKLKNNRCAFLSGEGWCDIYAALGEHYLSQTCQLYPRNLNKVNDTLEYSLTLSCPEAARKVLLNKKGIQFEVVTEEIGEIVISATLSAHKDHAKVWQDYFLDLRITLINLFQMKNLTFEGKWLQLEQLMKELNSLCASGAIKKIPGFLNKWSNPVISNLSSKSEPRMDLTQLKLLQKLVQMREEKKWPSSRYEQCYNEMLEGLKGNEQNIKEAYNEGYKKYLAAFLENHPYIFENYFVNYIYERLVPLDGTSVLKSYNLLLLYKNLIIIHLVGMANALGQLNEEKVVAFLQAFTKVFDHNEIYRQQLLKLLEAQ